MGYGCDEKHHANLYPILKPECLNHPTQRLLVTGRKARFVLYEACPAPWKISGLAESEKSRSLFLNQRETSEETAEETEALLG